MSIADWHKQTIELERQLEVARENLARELDTAAEGAVNGENALPVSLPATTTVPDNFSHHDQTRQRSHLRTMITVTGFLVPLFIAVALTAFGRSASWPPVVTRIRAEVAAACRNPDVKAEPAQVNFACGKNTQRILWVFAILTSGGNAHFMDRATGRVGLEPISPQQGGQIALSLNFSHAYNQLNPIDSIAVAARAINNIIGGATIIAPNGHLLVQPGLEGSPQNCGRYTGSAAVIVRTGIPPVCARPLTVAGQDALVHDVFRQWEPAASPQAAHDAVLLYANADNPGNAEAQAIIKRLSIAPA